MLPNEDVEFQRLAASAAEGDRDALESLLERSLPDLRAFVRLRIGPFLRSRAGVSDLVQSTCREILTHADRFQYPTEGAFRRWLFTTAHRKLVDQRSHWFTERRDAGREAGHDDGERAFELAYSRVATPSRHATIREQLERVDKAMGKLREDDRTIIVLSRVVGLSRDEIAEELGLTEGAVRMRLHRALASLSQVLE